MTEKQKSEIKDKLLSGSPELLTLIALYDGKEKDYAKEFLKERILSPTADIDKLLQEETLKIKSSRGWIKEINDIPLKKPVKSIDLIDKIQDYRHVASQPSDKYTIALYTKKPLPEKKYVVPPSSIGETFKQLEKEKQEFTNWLDEYPLDSWFHIPKKGGIKPVWGTWKHVEIKGDKFWKNMDTGEYRPASRFNLYKHFIKENIKKPYEPKPYGGGSEEPVEKSKPVSTEELVQSHFNNIEKRAEELTTAYSYGELKKMGKDNNLSLTGTKKEMISILIRKNIL